MDDAFREQGRRRARLERDAIEWVVGTIRERLAAADVDTAPLVETANATLAGIPSRHRAAFEGMLEELSVDRDVYAAYAFAFSELARALEDGTVEGSEGCTNVLVAASRAATDGSLVAKNRDVVGRGVRPVSIVEQPAIGEYHGYITVDTCGTVLQYKGVNDAGLVAANTHVGVAREEVDPGEGVRNGTVVRRILEECASVDEARALVDSYPARLFTGQTLLLADADDAVVLEVDPIAASVLPVTDPVVARTNHFLRTDSPRPDSSVVRLARARALLEDVDGPVTPGDLRTIATDHENGPGEDSICRHMGERADHAAAFGQETTVSASVFEGGRVAVDAAVGYPCADGFTTFEFGGEIPRDVRSGKRWLDLVTA